MTTVLVVDDEMEICENVRQILKKKGYNAYKAYNGRDALLVLEDKKIDVVLMDLRMPFLDGYETLKIIRGKYEETEVIIVSGGGDLETAVGCLREGAFGYIVKPINVEHLLLEIGHAVEHRQLKRENDEYRQSLEKKVEEKTAETQQLLRSMHKSFANFLTVFVELLSLYDPPMAGHAQRVALLVEKTGRKFSLDGKRLKNLVVAGLLHDLGTIGLSEKVRNTPWDKLSPEEVNLVKSQTVMTQNILSPMDNFQQVGAIIRSHLERVDGSGFPDNLRGGEISLESKILSVCNAYDEMRYVKRFMVDPPEDENECEELAQNNLRTNAKTQFDAAVVEKFIEAAHEQAVMNKKTAPVIPDELKEGMVLAADIRAGGKMILAKGSRLSAMQINIIKNLLEQIAPQTKVYVQLGEFI